ncbi:MAG: phosphotransferase [Gaiellaceae bacterium]
MQLPGGEGRAWLAGDVVLKPLALSMSKVELRWQGEVLGSLRPEGVRVAHPVPAGDGRLAVDGWYALARLEGRHEERRWLDVIAAGDLLHSALIRVPRPAFIGGRTDPWAIGDRVAWGELGPEPFLETEHVARLLAALEPLDEPSQLVHGDLTGNVLFAEGLPPAVIDFAPYWRPRAFAAAIVVADALVWEGADDTLLDAAPRQHVLRALIYRLVVNRLFGGNDDFAPAVELALIRK